MASLKKDKKDDRTEKEASIKHLSIHGLSSGNDSAFRCAAVQTVACRQLRLRPLIGSHKAGSY
jgi:hypothetical protein